MLGDEKEFFKDADLCNHKLSAQIDLLSYKDWVMIKLFVWFPSK